MLRTFCRLPRTTAIATRPLTIARGIHAESAGAKEAYIERLTGDQEGIAVLKLDRPAARNALSIKLLREFREALEEIRFSRYKGGCDETRFMH